MSLSEYIENFLEDYKNIQMKFLEILEDDENNEENFQNLLKLFEDTKIRDCPHKLRQFLYLLLKVSNNHHHGPNFFSDIDRILLIIKDDIKRIFTNSEIFNFFKSNKRILLFLIEKGIMTVDEYFVKEISNKKYLKAKYPEYFAPEIKPFLLPKNNELPDNFYELRNKGENDSYICQLIREDLVEDFIVYINKNSISPNATIDLSIYETNSFLIKNQGKIKLIEYASFYGSIQIFNFLKYEGAELKSSLLIDAIHSKNAELINLLEEVVKNREEIYKNCLNEAIKCHHNDIANYFINNYLQNNDEYSDNVFIQSLKYYNFSFLKNENINKLTFNYLCQYDYYILVKGLITSSDVNINHEMIQN